MNQPLSTSPRQARPSIRSACASTARSVALLGGLFGFLSAGGCRQEKMMTEPELISVQSFAKSWEASIPLVNGDSVRSLYLLGDNIYAVTENNTAFAIASGSGAIVHSEVTTKSFTPIRPPLLIGEKGERVLYPTANSLEIFDNKTGLPSESIDLEHSTSGPGVAEADTIYIGLDYPTGARLAAIDLKRQFNKTRWELQTGGAVQGSPVIFQHVIFIPSADGRIHTCDAQRSAVWGLRQSAFQTDGPITGDLKADEFGVYAASQDSKLYCIDRITGKTKWLYYAGASLGTGPVVTATMVYQYVPGRGIVAIDKTQGKPNRDARWAFAGAKGFLSEDDKYTYLRTDDNSIVAVDKQKGTEMFRSRGNEWRAFAVNVKDSTIYASTAGGEVYAIKSIIKPGVVGEVVMGSSKDGAWRAAIER